MQPDERRDLDRFSRLLDLLLQVNPEMSVRQAMTFVYMALNPSATLTDVANATGALLAAVSRHSYVLAGAPPSRAALVATGYGKNGREKHALLTERGRQLTREIVQIMRGT